ncbi:MAG: PadR family transcriptional regulator [Halobacteriaceae archaeon]
MSEAHSGTQSTARSLTAFQRNVLAVLATEPMYGLAVKRELESYYGSEVNHGRLYPNLDDLVELGYVEKSELDKRTNQYAITDEGADALFDDISWKLDRVLASDEYADRARTLVDE